MTGPGADPLRAGGQAGRIAALAATGVRDLLRCVARHPDLFAAATFDTAMLHAIALANASAAPDADPGTLRVADRAALFVFALDWLVDSRTQDPARVADAVRDCRAVAAGAPPATGPGRLLAEVRDDLAADVRPRWRAETERMITAMERERRWLAGRRPSFREYLDNADNTGFVFVVVSHRLHTAGAVALDDLVAAARAGQRVLRLVNDLATWERDEATGDLNALHLLPGRAAVRARLAGAVGEFRRLLRGLDASCPEQGAVLARQIGFATGFYDVTDFWGAA